MTISLRPITKDNWWPVARLKVTDAQRNFVADNTYSLLQAHYEPEYKLTPLGIYEDETPVGFVMYGQYVYEGQPWWAIWRLMIDVQHQRKGYGRAAILQTIERMKTTIGCNEVYISFVPANVEAKGLYTSLGFEDTGIVDEDEVVYRLKLTKG